MNTDNQNDATIDKSTLVSILDLTRQTLKPQEYEDKLVLLLVLLLVRHLSKCVNLPNLQAQYEVPHSNMYYVTYKTGCRSM